MRKFQLGGDFFFLEVFDLGMDIQMISRPQVEFRVSDPLEDCFIEADQAEVHLLLSPPYS